MSHLRRLIWHIASRLLILTLVLGLLITGFYYAMNMTNIYIVLKDGMARRAQVVMMTEDMEELRKYFYDSFLNRDSTVQTVVNGTSPYQDYNIVGIHGGPLYQDQGIVKNTDNLIRCMQNPKTFFVSHPDDGWFPLDYDAVVQAAKAYGAALEVNNPHVKYPWRKNCLENIRTYLALCMQYRVPIFVGSDAHDPSQVGNFDEAIALLDEIGFDEDLILNNSEAKFRRFIGMPMD